MYYRKLCKREEEGQQGPTRAGDRTGGKKRMGATRGSG